jgi:hypothetical protein
MIRVWLLWNDAQMAQFQVLDEKVGFPTVGKTGDMIISLGFRFKNAIQRIGGTRPAAEYRDRPFAHTSPASITKQFYNEMFCLGTRPRPPFAHLGIQTLSKAEDLSGEFLASAVATTTSLELRSSGPKECRQTWHDSMEFQRRSSFQSSHTQMITMLREQFPNESEAGEILGQSGLLIVFDLHNLLSCAPDYQYVRRVAVFRRVTVVFESERLLQPRVGMRRGHQDLKRFEFVLGFRVA